MRKTKRLRKGKKTIAKKLAHYEKHKIIFHSIDQVVQEQPMTRPIEGVWTFLNTPEDYQEAIPVHPIAGTIALDLNGGIIGIHDGRGGVVLSQTPDFHDISLVENPLDTQTTMIWSNGIDDLRPEAVVRGLDVDRVYVDEVGFLAGDYDDLRPEYLQLENVVTFNNDGGNSDQD